MVHSIRSHSSAAPSSAKQLPHGRPDRLRREIGNHGATFGDPHRRNRFDHDLIGRHDALPFDNPEPRLDPGEPVLVGGYLLFELGAAQDQHAAHVGAGDRVVQESADLVQREPELFQRDDPIQSRQLTDLVEAVPADGIDPLGYQ